jgi:hypothetical protein
VAAVYDPWARAQAALDQGVKSTALELAIARATARFHAEVQQLARAALRDVRLRLRGTLAALKELRSPARARRPAHWSGADHTCPTGSPLAAPNAWAPDRLVLVRSAARRAQAAQPHKIGMAPVSLPRTSQL